MIEEAPKEALYAIVVNSAANAITLAKEFSQLPLTGNLTAGEINYTKMAVDSVKKVSRYQELYLQMSSGSPLPNNTSYKSVGDEAQFSQMYSDYANSVECPVDPITWRYLKGAVVFNFEDSIPNQFSSLILQSSGANSAGKTLKCNIQKLFTPVLQSRHYFYNYVVEINRADRDGVEKII